MNLFRNLFKRRRREESLTFVMEVDGHRLYKFSSLEVMSQFRFIGLKLSLEKVGLGVRPADSIAYNKVQRELDAESIAAVSQKDDALFHNIMEQKAALRNEYEFQLKEFAGRRLMAEIGGIGIIVDDEPLNKFSLKHNKIKAKLLENDEVLFFFFENTTSYMNQLREDLDGLTIVKILKDPQVMMRMMSFSQKIGVAHFKALWSPTMVKLSGLVNNSEEEESQT